MAKIIIVDDSVSIRMQARKVLEDAGHMVFEAQDGNEGLKTILEVKTPDLVVCDYNMPGMDGISMINKVNAVLGEKAFPVLMMTTETSESLRQMGRAAGVIGWLSKPFKHEMFDAAKFGSRRPTKSVPIRPVISVRWRPGNSDQSARLIA